MRFLRKVFLALAALAFPTLPSPCFANRQCKIPFFTPPVQNYAVIDISGSVQCDSTVAEVALDDSNTAAFAFCSASAALPLPDGYPPPDANAQAYTWNKKGSAALSADFYTDLTVRTDVPDGGYNYNAFFAYLGGVDTSGTVYGPMFNMLEEPDPSLGGAYVAEGQIACLYSSTGTGCSPINPPYPFTQADDSGSGGGPVAVSPLGSLIAIPNTDQYLNLNQLPYIYSAGNYTAFVGDADFSGITPAANLSLAPYVFAPYFVNDNGDALGYGEYLTTELWLNQTSSMIPINGDAPCCLNDQDQLGLQNEFGGVGSDGGGYLWESGATTFLRETLPFWFAWQILATGPFSISNQVKAQPQPPASPDPTADATIHILATAQDIFPASQAASINGQLNTLWTRDNTNKWSYAEIALPVGTNITRIVSINSSGVIAALGNGGHALLLLPVDIIDQNGNTLSSLTVANMASAGVLTGTPDASTGDLDSVVLQPDSDPARYYIRLRGAASLGSNVTVGVETRENPDASYDDPGNDLTLYANSNDLLSKSLLLASDDVDSQYPVDGVTSDSLNDRTHRIQLGGKFRINKIAIGSQNNVTAFDYPVPASKHLQFRITILRATPGGAPVVDPASVAEDIKLAQDRYAQAGISLSATVRITDPPQGIDLANGLYLSQVLPNESTDVQTLISALGTPTIDDIDVFYINFFFPNTLIKGVSILASEQLPDTGQYGNNIIIASGRGPFTLAHELGHILTQDGSHYANPILIMRGGGTSVTDTIGGSKRFTLSEITTIQQSYLVH